MLPDAPLYAADGVAVRLSGYRHRKHLVLLVFAAHDGEPGASVPGPLAARHKEFTDENAEVVAVFPASPPRSGLPGPFPFPVLEDRTGALSRLLPENDSREAAVLSVHIADRYGELFRSLDVPAGVPFPAEEILSWLRFLERLCPE
jgi:hypothetical protein